jgi:hypothetical protein
MTLRQQCKIIVLSPEDTNKECRGIVRPRTPFHSKHLTHNPRLDWTITMKPNKGAAIMSRTTVLAIRVGKRHGGPAGTRYKIVAGLSPRVAASSSKCARRIFPKSIPTGRGINIRGSLWERVDRSVGRNAKGASSGGADIAGTSVPTTYGKLGLDVRALSSLARATLSYGSFAHRPRVRLVTCS